MLKQAKKKSDLNRALNKFQLYSTIDQSVFFFHIENAPLMRIYLIRSAHFYFILSSLWARFEHCYSFMIGTKVHFPFEYVLLHVIHVI